MGASVTIMAALRSDPVTPAAKNVDITFPDESRIADLGPRLPRLPKVRNAALSIAGQATGLCMVTVSGALSQAGTLEVTIFDSRLGTVHARRLVDKGSKPSPLEFRGLPLGNHRVHLARATASARRNYIDHAEVIITRNQPRVSATLHATTRSLRLALRADGERKRPASDIPVWIRRKDDADWRYQASGRHELLTDAEGRIVFHDLAPGAYTLHMHGFDVTAPHVKRLAFELSEFDATRPIVGRVR